MVASGPFAMGPAASGSSTSFRRGTNETFTPVTLGSSRVSAGSASLPEASVPGVKGENQEWEVSDDELNVLEEEGGEQKVDMRYVERLDWSAPVALKQGTREQRSRRPKKEQGVQERCHSRFNT